MGQSGVGSSLSFGLVIERLTPLSDEQVANKLDVAGLKLRLRISHKAVTLFGKEENARPNLQGIGWRYVLPRYRHR